MIYDNSYDNSKHFGWAEILKEKNVIKNRYLANPMYYPNTYNLHIFEELIPITPIVMCRFKKKRFRMYCNNMKIHIIRHKDLWKMYLINILSYRPKIRHRIFNSLFGSKATVSKYWYPVWWAFHIKPIHILACKYKGFNRGYNND